MANDTKLILVGTFCPQCEKPYTGLEITMGRPPEYRKQLVPITRCNHCGNLHAWLPEITNKIENT